MRESNSRFTTAWLNRISPYENSDVADWMMIDLFTMANSDPKKKPVLTDKPWDQVKDTNISEDEVETSKISSDKFEKLQKLKKELYTDKPVLEEKINLMVDSDTVEEDNGEHAITWTQE